MEKFPSPDNASEVAPKKENIDISKEDGIEVLENLEITEKNREFAERMAEIEAELKSRTYLEKINTDTGEVKKGGPSQFDFLKERFGNETKKNLTRPSKYVKGAVISGVIAAGLFVDAYNLGPISTMADMISSETWMATTLAELAGGVMLGIKAMRDSYKAVRQTIRTKAATNQKMQRFVGMLAGGMKEGLAQTVVNTEAHKSGGYKRAGEKEISRGSYNDTHRDIKEVDQQTIAEVRKKLDEMGIKRIDRREYADKKKQVYS